MGGTIPEVYSTCFPYLANSKLSFQKVMFKLGRQAVFDLVLPHLIVQCSSKGIIYPRILFENRALAIVLNSPTRANHFSRQMCTCVYLFLAALPHTVHSNCL